VYNQLYKQPGHPGAVTAVRPSNSLQQQQQQQQLLAKPAAAAAALAFDWAWTSQPW
jgi:hypothetical protein